MEKDVEYLEKDLRGIMQPLLQSLLKVRPEDPIKYMIDWVKQYIGIYTLEHSNFELQELYSLRKEIKYYHRKYNLSDFPNKTNKLNSSKSDDSSDSNSEKDEQLTEEEFQNALAKIKKHKSISAEAYGKYYKKKEYIPKIVPKSDLAKIILHEKIDNNFLFKELTEKEKKVIIDAMEKKKYNKGDYVIKEGENGDCIYLVENGLLSCTKFINGENKKVHEDYKSGDSFGELALLYNCPRAATIKALSNCILWKMERECFNSIIKDVSLKRKEMYEKILRKIDIFSTFNNYEIGVMCDSFQRKYVKKGNIIIKQNDEGDIFYILEEGECYATKNIDGKEENVKLYSKGAYFGELALLKNEPRAANVYAKTDCVLLALDRKSFKRLLGPIEDLLIRNADKYIKYVNKK